MRRHPPVPPATRPASLVPVALAAALCVAGPALAQPEGEAAAAEGVAVPAAVARGEYIFDAAGCLGCHSVPGDEAGRLAGGRALETPFGTFHSPNITPDPGTGIGAWSLEDLRRALREGVSPAGETYFPAFPYVAYTGMTDADIEDLWAYLQTVTPVERANTPHALDAPFGWRELLPLWRMLYFEAGPRQVPLGRSPDWYRGAYLVEVLGHCGECHTPRDWLGGLDTGRAFAGAAAAPTGTGSTPNITPHADGIGGWTAEDLEWFLADGMTPEGDFVGGSMAEVIRHSTARLDDADRRAIATYLLALPPLPDG